MTNPADTPGGWRFDTRTWALIPLAVALNMAVGSLVATFRIPLYLDSLGTVLVGALCGPAAGALTGAVANGVIAGMSNVAWLAFVPVAALIGVLSGALARRGFMASPSLAALAGFLVGVAAAVASAPISATLFGGTTGGGTDLVVAAFRAAGFSVVEATMAQGLVTDTLDKVVTFLVVQWLLATLPVALRRRYPQGERLGDLGTFALPGFGGRGEHGERRSSSLSAPPTLYRPGDGLLHRLAPFTKALLVALVAVAAFTFPTRLVTPGGTFPVPVLPGVAAALLALAAASGVGPALGRAVLAMGLPVAVSMVVVNGLFAPDAVPVLEGFGRWSWNGALDALGLALRLVVLLEAFLLLLLTTPPDALMADLERRGLPHRLAWVGLASLNLVPTMLRRAAEILEAQTARGLPLGRGPAGRLRALLPLAGPLVLGSLAEVEERALALEARGFAVGARRTWLDDPPGTPLDPWLQALLALSTLALLARPLLP